MLKAFTTIPAEENEMNILPQEIWEHIFKYLNAQDLLNIGLVRQWFQIIVKQDHFWKGLVARYFPYLQHLNEIQSDVKKDPKSLFILTYQYWTADEVCQNLTKKLLHAAIVGDVEIINQATNLRDEEIKNCLITLVANNHLNLLLNCHFWNAYNFKQKGLVLNAGCFFAARRGNHIAVKSILAYSESKGESESDSELSSDPEFDFDFNVSIVDGAVKGLNIAVEKGYELVVAEILGSENAYRITINKLAMAAQDALKLGYAGIARLLIKSIKRENMIYAKSIIERWCGELVNAAEAGDLDKVKSFLAMGLGSEIGEYYMTSSHTLTTAIAVAANKEKIAVVDAILEIYHKPEECFFLSMALNTITQVIVGLAGRGDANLLNKLLGKMSKVYPEHSKEFHHALSEKFILVARKGKLEKMRRFLSVGIGTTISLYTHDNRATLLVALAEAKNANHTALAEVLDGYIKQLASRVENKETPSLQPEIKRPLTFQAPVSSGSDNETLSGSSDEEDSDVEKNVEPKNKKARR